MNFNWCVACYWPNGNGSIGVYSFGTAVHFGTLKTAEVFLKYCKRQSPDKDWRIFQVIEVPRKEQKRKKNVNS